MCEASHMKFAPVYHKILQVYMYENVTYGPSQLSLFVIYSRIYIYAVLIIMSKEIKPYTLAVSIWLDPFLS